MTEEEKIEEQLQQNDTSDDTSPDTPNDDDGEVQEQEPEHLDDLEQEKELLQPEWVEDFKDITTNVYEAIMVISRRARQIGMQQKREIDNYNKSLETELEGGFEGEEDTMERKEDTFHHQKPTVKAMLELKNSQLSYFYTDDEK